MTTVILYSFASGITIIFGGLLAKFNLLGKGKFHREMSRGIIAFGGGILIGAIAFVLVPQGLKTLSLLPIIAFFFAGSVTFLFLDKFISQKVGRASQLMAMIMDYIPEAIALGSVFAFDNKTGLLLAIFIGLQNLPESYNSFSDLRSSGFSPNKSLLILAPFSLAGIAAALIGYTLLTGKDQLIAFLMLFSAGGILYLVFQDIAPMAKLRNHWSPPLGATLGFMVAIIGEKMLG